MPIKSNFGEKKCLECDSIIIHRIKRDIERKKFCSRNCKGKYYGKRRPIEHLKKMQELACTLESNLKKIHRGKDHPLYKHDRTQIKSPRPRYENTEWKKQVFNRDNFTCQKCGIRGGKLQADHIKPYCICTEEEKWNLDNGRTLCLECHKKTKSYGRKKENILKEFENVKI